jgi:methylated-DNA-protein-cysteine methyltransferase-like protein
MAAGRARKGRRRTPPAGLLKAAKAHGVLPGAVPREPLGRWERVYAVVRRIPRGRVATYGQIAALAGLGGQARQVGYALHALPGEGFAPWHRVVNARGAISLPPAGGADVTQRLRLEREGVRFDARGRIDLARHGWRPGAARRRPRGLRPAPSPAASAPGAPRAGRTTRRSPARSSPR